MTTTMQKAREERDKARAQIRTLRAALHQIIGDCFCDKYSDPQHRVNLALYTARQALRDTDQD